MLENQNSGIRNLGYPSVFEDQLFDTPKHVVVRPLLAYCAYFGDRDRPFRRIVTAAQRAVLRVEILMHTVTMERFFLARQGQVGASPYAGVTAAGRALPAVTVRDCP